MKWYWYVAGAAALGLPVAWALSKKGPPVLRLTLSIEPVGNPQVGTTWEIKAHTKSNIDLVMVELYWDGDLVSTATVPGATKQYTANMYVGASDMMPGTHTLEVVAYDMATSVSETINVTIY